MKLSLNDLIGSPGAVKPFSFSLDLRDLHIEQVESMGESFPVTGEVRNVAGALELTAEVQIAMVRLCDRCMEQISIEEVLSVSAHLAETLEDEDNPDIFLIEDGCIDVDEVITTAFILGLAQKVVCREDCQGLCTTCGANLNQGPCTCKEEIDPRLAVLQQLLDGDES